MRLSGFDKSQELVNKIDEPMEAFAVARSSWHRQTEGRPCTTSRRPTDGCRTLGGAGALSSLVALAVSRRRLLGGPRATP